MATHGLMRFLAVSQRVTTSPTRAHYSRSATIGYRCTVLTTKSRSTVAPEHHRSTSNASTSRRIRSRHCGVKRAILQSDIARRSSMALTKNLRSLVWSIDGALLGAALVGLVVGVGFALYDRPEIAKVAWTLATLPVLFGLLVQIVTTLRRGGSGLDIIAALSMTAALAFGETLAGNVVALMYAGGQFLEKYAETRARREMTALLGRVARTTMRHTPGG